MRKLTEAMMVAAALFILAGAADAGDRSTMTRSTTTVPSATVDAKSDASLLESERDELAWEAHNNKGVKQSNLRAEEERVQELIDGLQRGDKVDPVEVDRILNRTY
jgi:hypothetical protein